MYFSHAHEHAESLLCSWALLSSPSVAAHASEALVGTHVTVWEEMALPSLWIIKIHMDFSSSTRQKLLPALRWRKCRLVDTRGIGVRYFCSGHGPFTTSSAQVLPQPHPIFSFLLLQFLHAWNIMFLEGNNSRTRMSLFNKNDVNVNPCLELFDAPVLASSCLVGGQSSFPGDNLLAFLAKTA